STIAHAIIDAYSMASIKERSPEVHLFLEMPPDQVDVNVHPTKAEVRFRDQSMVHEVVRRALKDALGAGGVPQLQLRPEHATQPPTASALPGVLSGGAYPSRWLPDPVRLKADTTSEPSASSPSQDVVSGFSRTDPAPEIRPMIPLGQFRD